MCPEALLLSATTLKQTTYTTAMRITGRGVEGQEQDEANISESTRLLRQHWRASSRVAGDEHTDNVHTQH